MVSRGRTNQELGLELDVLAHKLGTEAVGTPGRRLGGGARGSLREHHR